MKKILFLMIIIPFIANAQFKATVDGMKTIDGTEYYIADVPNKTAQQIYNAVNSYIMTKFKNPDAVTNKQDSQMINLHGVFTDAFVAKSVLGSKIYAEADMNLIMMFKDGKIRFNNPVINSMEFNSNGDEVQFYAPTVMGMTTNIVLFKKDGKPKKKDVILNLENFVNETIKSIVESATKTDNW